MEYVTKQMQTYQTGKSITDQFYIDDDYNVLYTLSEGRIVYDHQKDTDVFNDEFLAAYKIA